MMTYSDLQKIRTLFDDPTVAMLSPHHPEDYSPLLLGEADSDESNSEGSPTPDAYSSDQFRMYEFKVRRCARGRAHDWTQCPYSHPGEKARRRDPRRFCYSGESCSEFRVSGSCRRGDACEFAHGVFETWLHPSRYRTQHCKDGAACRRRVCFFAHTPEQLRVLSGHDGSPRFQALKSPPGSSPTSILMPPASNSPPLSPVGSALRRPVQPSCVEELVASLREMQLSHSKSFPVSWGLGYGSAEVSGAAPMFRSLPATPTVGASSRRWKDWCPGEEEMERVESGKDLRAKMFEKLKEENMEKKGTESDTTVTTVTPDVGWVSELLR